MTYDAREISDTDGNPYYFYRFTRGGVTYQFNSTDEEMDGGVLGLFEGSSVSHSKYAVGSATKKDQISFTFPLSHPFASLFLGKVTRYLPTAVTVWRGHFDDPDDERFVIFKGKIKSAKPKNKTTIELNASSIFVSMEDAGLGAIIQKPCRHALYHGRCGLDRNDWDTAGTVTSLTGNLLTVDGAGAFDDGYFSFGMIEYNGFLTFILNHVGDEIRLRTLPDDLATEYGNQLPGPVSIPISLFPGCDRSIQTCRAKFNNSANFGGFPYIPQVDPWANGSIA